MTCIRHFHLPCRNFNWKHLFSISISNFTVIGRWGLWEILGFPKWWRDQLSWIISAYRFTFQLMAAFYDELFGAKKQRCRSGCWQKKITFRICGHRKLVACFRGNFDCISKWYVFIRAGLLKGDWGKKKNPSTMTITARLEKYLRHFLLLVLKSLTFFLFFFQSHSVI